MGYTYGYRKSVIQLTANGGLNKVIILGMGSSNERRRYKVTLSLIDWAHTQNDHCVNTIIMALDYRPALSCYLVSWYVDYMKLLIFSSDIRTVGVDTPLCAEWYETLQLSRVSRLNNDFWPFPSNPASKQPYHKIKFPKKKLSQ